MKPIHWHVQPHGESDVERAETLVLALGVAAQELDRLAEHEHELITACGESGAYEDAYRAFVRSETFTGLALNARNAHHQGTVPREERAPLYRSPDEGKNLMLIDQAANHVLQEIYRTGPDAFRIWECIVDPCDLDTPQ